MQRARLGIGDNQGMVLASTEKRQLVGEGEPLSFSRLCVLIREGYEFRAIKKYVSTAPPAIDSILSNMKLVDDSILLMFNSDPSSSSVVMLGSDLCSKILYFRETGRIMIETSIGATYTLIP
jgi:hypothetical protein